MTSDGFRPTWCSANEYVRKVQCSFVGRDEKNVPEDLWGENSHVSGRVLGFTKLFVLRV